MDEPPAPPRMTPKKPVRNPFSVMEPGEQIICEVKRHPAGILGLYAAAGLLMLIVAIAAFLALPPMLSGYSHTQAVTLAAAIVLMIGVICGIFLLVGTRIYWANSWVVSSDSITQIRQVSLFNKQTSQLSLGDLEDITAEQVGILPQMLNYGTLSAETAGAVDKFTLTFCSNPDYYARKILAARERFEQHLSRGAERRPAKGRASAGKAVDLGIAAVESLSEEDN